LMFLPRHAAGFSVSTLSIVATIAIICWRHSFAPVDRIGGDILVCHDGMIQRDAFVYERAKESSVQNIPFAGWTHPIFASSMGLNQSQMKLTMSSIGELTFTYHAISGHTMAFLRREVGPGSLPAVSAENHSPMRDVAKLEYLSSGGWMAGEVPGLRGRWGGVVIEKQK
jgi:hypothetical protein